MDLLFIYPLIAALLLLVVPELKFKRKRRSRINTKTWLDNGFIKWLTHNKYICPQRGIRFERAKKLLGNNGYSSIEKFYITKLALSVALVFLTVLVQYSNFQLDYRNIVDNLNYKTNIAFFESQIKDEKKEELKAREQNFFLLIRESLTRKEVLDIKNRENVKKEIDRLIETSRKKINEDRIVIVNRLYNKIYDYYSITNIQYYNYLIILLIAYMLPNLYLHIRAFVNRYNADSEVALLENVTVFVGRLNPIKTREIIDILIGYSYIFKPYLNKLKYDSTKNDITLEETYKNITSAANNKEFKLLCETLRDFESGSINESINNLSVSIKQNRERRRKVAKDKLEIKRIITIFIIIFVLTYLGLYMLRPWQAIYVNPY
ncbi:MAG: hypothetical protein AB7G87_04915 [Clostridia bacterium]